MPRVDDRLLGIFALVAALALCLWLVDRWRSIPVSSPGAETGVQGLVVAGIQGPRLELGVLGGQDLSISGQRADLMMPELGPLQINMAPTALQLSHVEAQLGGAGLHIRAERCRVDKENLLFSGAVRLDTNDGRGLLFTDRLSLSLTADRLSTGPLVVLAPEGVTGGRGGRVVEGFAASLAQVLQRTR